MKKLNIFCLTIILLISSFRVSVFAQPQSETANETHPQFQVNASYGIDSEITLLGNDRLVKNLRSAIVFEANSNTLMYAWNADTQLFPASFVKIITALVAIEKGNLADIVTVSADAIASVPHDAVSAELVAGEEISLENLLYCLLLGSANDAAVVIAEHISGTEAAFVDLLNSYAIELGCKDTHFVNAHGLHSQQQYTTARDSARILAAAIKNEDFYRIFTATKHTIGETNKTPLRNLLSGNLLMDPNSKLYYDSRVVGGRTGVTEDGRRCLAAVAENNGMQLITVVMGADSVYQEDGYSAVSIGGYQETTALLNAGLTGFKTAQILYTGQILRQFHVENGNNDLLVGTNESITTILPENATLADLTFQYHDIHFTAPVEKGKKVSVLEVWHQNMCVARVDLLAMNAVPIKQVANSDTDNSSSGLPTVIVILLIIMLLSAAGLFTIRFYSKIKFMLANKHSKQYRRSRRRSR